MHPIPSSTEPSSHHHNDSSTTPASTAKDYNPHLESLKKAFLTHDDFIHKVKQQFSRSSPDGASATKPMATNQKSLSSSKPASFLLSPGLLLTPAALVVSKASGSGGGGMLRVEGGGLRLPRPNSYAGVRRKSLRRGDSVYEGILSRVKTLESGGGGGGGGGGGESEMKITMITTTHTAPDYITLNINGENFEKSKEERNGEGAGDGGIKIAKKSKAGASNQGERDEGMGIGSSRSIDQILGLSAIQIKDGHVILERVDYEAVLAKSEMELCAMEDGGDMDSVLEFLNMVKGADVAEREQGVKLTSKGDEGMEFGEVPSVLVDAVKKMARKVEVAIKFAEEMDQQVAGQEDEDADGESISNFSNNESLEELNIRPPRLSLLKKKTVMNTWVSGQKSIIKRPSTFVDIMKETKEKYQTAGKLNAAARSGPINPTPRVSTADQSNGRERINSIVGLPATPRQFLDPTVYHVEKQMESWLGLVKQMHKRNGTRQKSRGKRRGKFHDPVKIVIMLSTLGISPNLMSRVEIDTLRIVLAIKLWKKRAVESRTNRAMPIRKISQQQEKELMKTLPPPVKSQINEFAITVLALCVKRYSKLIGPNNVKTLKARKKLEEMEASIMPDFGLEVGGGGDAVSVGLSTFQEEGQGCYRFLLRALLSPKVGVKGDDGDSDGSGSINKLLVSTMSIGAMKKVYPMDEEEEDYQGYHSGEVEEGLGGGGFTRIGHAYGGGLGMIKGGGGNRIFPIIDEDGGGDA